MENKRGDKINFDAVPKACRKRTPYKAIIHIREAGQNGDSAIFRIINKREFEAIQMGLSKLKDAIWPKKENKN